MILDNLSQYLRYQSLAPGFDLGFAFLKRLDLLDLPNGRHTIDGDQVFAIIARDQGRGREASPLEFHRRHIDIQYVVQGKELIGWQSTPTCTHVRARYDADKDIGFFDDSPATWCHLASGDFAIFFPNDAHAPLAGEGIVHKVVVKVACDDSAFT